MASRKKRSPLQFRVRQEGEKRLIEIVSNDETMDAAQPVSQPEDGETDEFPQQADLELPYEQPEEIVYAYVDESSMELEETAEVEEPYTEWAGVYVNRDGVQTGPFTQKELRRHWANGVIDAEDLVWQEGMEDWIELRAYFGVPVLEAASPSMEKSDLLHNWMTGGQEASGALNPGSVLVAVASFLVMFGGAVVMVLSPDQQVYAFAAFGTALLIALIGAVLTRKAFLIAVLALNVMVPVLMWFLLGSGSAGDGTPGKLPPQNVQQEEKMPASTEKKDQLASNNA